MLGNAQEWIADCWNSTLESAPIDGSVWKQGDCTRGVVRGASWYNNASVFRVSNRYSNTSVNRTYISGFRVVRSLEP